MGNSFEPIETRFINRRNLLGLGVEWFFINYIGYFFVYIIFYFLVIPVIPDAWAIALNLALPILLTAAAALSHYKLYKKLKNKPENSLRDALVFYRERGLWEKGR